MLRQAVDASGDTFKKRKRPENTVDTVDGIKTKKKWHNSQGLKELEKLRKELIKLREQRDLKELKELDKLKKEADALMKDPQQRGAELTVQKLTELREAIYTLIKSRQEWREELQHLSTYSCLFELQKTELLDNVSKTIDVAQGGAPMPQVHGAASSLSDCPLGDSQDEGHGRDSLQPSSSENNSNEPDHSSSVPQVQGNGAARSSSIPSVGVIGSLLRLSYPLDDFQSEWRDWDNLQLSSENNSNGSDHPSSMPQVENIESPGLMAFSLTSPNSDSSFFNSSSNRAARSSSIPSVGTASVSSGCPLGDSQDEEQDQGTVPFFLSEEDREELDLFRPFKR